MLALITQIFKKLACRQAGIAQINNGNVICVICLLIGVIIILFS